MIKNRSTLKGYFTKGAIPTESNFADLIDSTLNQEEDNISKLPNDPLRVIATGVDEALLNFYRLDQNQEKLTWQVKQNLGGKAGLSISDDSNAHLFIENGTGKLGLGTNTPAAALDILQEPRTGTHPAAIRGLYVTGGTSASADGVEFRHTNGSQGIGFGYNTIYATGSIADQDLGLMARGNGKVISRGTLQVSGGQLQLDSAQKITFADGDVSNNLKLQLWTGYGLGINGSTLFYAANGRHSWRDASGANERMVLTTAPDGGLAVKGTGASTFAGNVQLGNSDLYFTKTDHNATGFGNTDGYAAIENAKDFDSLMILGRAHAGGRRVVKLWDYLQVNGDLNVTGNISTTGASIAWGNSILSADQGGSIELGGGNSTAGTGTSYIDFHLKDKVEDYNVRLINNTDKELSVIGTLDVQQASRSGTHPAGKGLYVTGDFSAASDGVEFRHSNGTQGIGFGYNTIYATGTNANQDLSLLARGTGKVNISSDLCVTEVYFTNTNHNHVGFANTAGAAAIENAVNFNALMILGRAGTPLGRNVVLYDTLTVNGTFNNNSDRRLKKDIEDLGYGLREILNLRPVEFNWINIPNPHKSLGFIAQEVQPVIGEVVYENIDNPEEGTLSIAYGNLVPVLVNAIKELSVRLSQLEDRAPASAIGA